MPITFLPLPLSFDRRSQRHWASISQRIADWLISVVADLFSNIWKWGREAFWISFVAAYPSFPNGEWPTWPTEISLEGAFISYWITHRQYRSHDREHNESGKREGEEDGDGDGDVGYPVAPAQHQQDIPILVDHHAELWARFHQHLSVLNVV